MSGDSPATGLAFAKLVLVIQQLLAAGVAPSTRRVYTTGALRYQEFSNSIGIEVYPTSERSLLLFVAFLFTNNLAPSTIKTYLAAVRYEQIGRGLGDPSMAQMPQLEYAIKGAKRLSKLKKRNRLPITPRLLLLLKKYWSSMREHENGLHDAMESLLSLLLWLFKVWKGGSPNGIKLRSRHNIVL